MSSIGLGSGETQATGSADDDGFLSRISQAVQDVAVGTLEGAGDVIASGFSTVAEQLPVWTSSVLEQQQRDQLDQDTNPTENETRRRASDLDGAGGGFDSRTALIAGGIGLLVLVVLIVLARRD